MWFRIEKNKGKAHAFNIGLASAKGKLILSNDAEYGTGARCTEQVCELFHSPGARHIAAVTANMDIQNRTKLIAKSQTVEFSVSLVSSNEHSQLFSVALCVQWGKYDVSKRSLDRCGRDSGKIERPRSISIAWDHIS